MLETTNDLALAMQTAGQAVRQPTGIEKGHHTVELSASGFSASREAPSPPYVPHIHSFTAPILIECPTRPLSTPSHTSRLAVRSTVLLHKVSSSCSAAAAAHLDLLFDSQPTLDISIDSKMMLSSISDREKQYAGVLKQIQTTLYPMEEKTRNVACEEGGHLLQRGQSRQRHPAHLLAEDING
ncbi:hypothetical protein FBULB1_8292 [Fusarium bulbicola]|nr:hypothetical protein FBULB1_8292 [Fusarium bulbicola]